MAERQACSELGGLTMADVAAGQFDPLRANRVPPTATLILLPGEVVVSRNAKEFARFGEAERASRRRGKCSS